MILWLFVARSRLFHISVLHDWLIGTMASLHHAPLHRPACAKCSLLASALRLLQVGHLSVGRLTEGAHSTRRCHPRTCTALAMKLMTEHELQVVRSRARLCADPLIVYDGMAVTGDSIKDTALAI